MGAERDLDESIFFAGGKVFCVWMLCEQCTKSRGERERERECVLFLAVGWGRYVFLEVIVVHLLNLGVFSLCFV